MATLYENNIRGTISPDITVGATTIVSSVFSALPTVTSPDVLWLTLDPEAAAGAPEIVKVTAHTSASTSVTVVRGEQGSTARAHADATEVVLAATSTDYTGFLTLPQLPAVVLPTGSFLMGGWSTAPTGCLLLDGSTIVGGASTYADLAGVFPAWVSGSDLVLPNATGAVPLAAASAGAVSGSMSHTLTEAQLPSHTHSTPDHSHSGSTSNYGHFHSADDGRGGFTQVQSGSGTTVNQGVGSGNVSTDNHSHSVSVSGGAGTSGATGSGSVVDHTPKNLTVRMAVKF